MPMDAFDLGEFLRCLFASHLARPHLLCATKLAHSISLQYRTLVLHILSIFSFRNYYNMNLTDKHSVRLLLKLIFNLSSHIPQVSVFICCTNRKRKACCITQHVSMLYEAISIMLYAEPNLETKIRLLNRQVWFLPIVVLNFVSNLIHINVYARIRHCSINYQVGYKLNIYTSGPTLSTFVPSCSKG